MAGRRNLLLSVLVRTAVSVALIASAIVVATLLVRTRPVPARSTDAAPPPRVKVMAARAVAVRREWQGFGTAQAMDYANVPARVSTTVRTIPMEIVAGENSVYTILAFVAMKMEMSWRNAPFRNSGFRKLKPFAGYFTHES